MWFTLDEHKYACTGLMYLSKAIDCVPHIMLIATMQTYGLSTNAAEYLCPVI